MAPHAKRDFWVETVGHLPIQHPTCLTQENTVEEAVIAMQESRLGCILVVDEKQKLIGLYTDRDVMEGFVASSLPRNTPLSKIMVSDPHSINMSTTIAQAVEVFHEKHVRHLPVLEGTEIRGLLSIRVLMDFIAENLPGHILNLPPDSTNVAKNAVGG